MHLHIHRQKNLLVGHLSMDAGILDWHSWVESDGSGLAWNGVCENFLGTRFSGQDIQDVYTRLSRSPAAVCDWDGSFYVIAWNKARDAVYLTTGATDCPTLWHTRGPRGWAAGSRGAPLLEMVGREKQISAVAAAVYLAYGYNYTNESLLKHVQRLPQRSRVTIQPGAEPDVSVYAGISDLMTTANTPTRRADILEASAERLVERVSRQLRYSAGPGILITGGRDSRCVAAAAKHAGYSGVVSTGGAADSCDVVIGAKVAQRLGLAHVNTPDRVPMDEFGKHIDRLKLWSCMSEGVEVLRHVRAYNCFVAEKPPPAARQQLFHGLGGEIRRGYYYHTMADLHSLNGRDYTIGRRILLAAANPEVPLTKQARDLLETRWDEFTEDLGTDQASVAQWLDMFFWQNSCLRWGGDMLSVKSPMYWIWTPFLDRQLISHCWHLDPEDKRSNRFIDDLALKLAVELDGLEYDVSAACHTAKRSISTRVCSKFRHIIKRRLLNRMTSVRSAAAAGHCDHALIQFWEDVLLNATDPVWRECLDKKTVRRIIYSDPASELLWNAATIQLVADACC